jgi:hypothetical protein
MHWRDLPRIDSRLGRVVARADAAGGQSRSGVTYGKAGAGFAGRGFMEFPAKWVPCGDSCSTNPFSQDNMSKMKALYA